MSDQQHEKVSKLLESRKKAESEVRRKHQQTNEAVENGDRRAHVERLATSCKDTMTRAINRHDELVALTLKVDSASLLKEQVIWLNVLTTTNDGVLKRARRYIDSLPATDRASQTLSKTTKTVSNRSATSKTSSQRQKELSVAKHRRELERQHEGEFCLAKQKQEIELRKFQHEQQRLQLKEHLHQKRLQRLQEQERQLQFEQRRLQKEQMLQVPELEEEARRIGEAKIAEIQLTDDLPGSTEEKELKDTLSQLRAASRGAESQRVTDWVHNGSVENSTQSQHYVADADPSA